MKQVVQHYSSGELVVEDVPVPALRPGQLLVETRATLISSGTERSTVDMARKGLVGKAQARPDLVRKVLQSAAKDGVAQTAKLVRGRLDSQAALGYSAAGVVSAVGAGVAEWRVGDRVACAGQDHASHAEFIAVPKNLCVPVPAMVTDLQASYVAVGSIALQGVRQVAPNLGETVAVIGLGLVGQLTVQLLRANGCEVVATDLDSARCALAAQDPGVCATDVDFSVLCGARSRGHGVDAVIITASARSNEPMALAAEIVRKRGRVVVVGAVGMDLPRDPFYLKEVDLRLSTSYGPGRYDASYEEGGQDYPYAYVRWTEQRNMSAFLALAARGQLDLDRLTTDVFEIDQAPAAYERLLEPDARSLGMVLTYPREEGAATATQTIHLKRSGAPVPGQLEVAVIGAGNHFKDVLLPQLLKREGVRVRAVCGSDGVRTRHAAERARAELGTTDVDAVLSDDRIHAVIIGTRHDSHAELIIRALGAGKHVFCEKPLCINGDQLSEIRDVYANCLKQHPRVLQIGFNRRYSPHLVRLREFFAGRQDPLTMLYRVNAGAIAGDHWIQDSEQGGGRIVGEACHFIDFMAAVVGAPPRASFSAAVPAHSSGITQDKATLCLEFADGSIGTLLYTADGGKGLAKEYFEAHGVSRSAVLDDFSTTRFWKGGRSSVFRTRPRDRGFAAELDAFFSAIRIGRPDPEQFEVACAVTAATFNALPSNPLRYREVGC